MLPPGYDNSRHSAAPLPHKCHHWRRHPKGRRRRYRRIYAETLYKNAGATLDDLREAVTTLEETTQTARRVLGSAHPLTSSIECYLQNARAALRARDGGVSAIRNAIEAMTAGSA